MGWKDFFGLGKKKARKEEPDLIGDLSLAKLKKGWFVDFDDKSWQVEAYNYYNWGSRDITHEWQLKSHDETIYLGKESDDEVHWSISRKIPIGSLGPGITKHIIENEDPPDQIVFEGNTFYLEESGGGYFFKDGKEPRKELLSWDYSDDPGENFLSIEQWGEEDFEASAGESVEEYRFTNILPIEEK